MLSYEAWDGSQRNLGCCMLHVLRLGTNMLSFVVSATTTPLGTYLIPNLSLHKEQLAVQMYSLTVIFLKCMSSATAKKSTRISMHPSINFFFGFWFLDPHGRHAHPFKIRDRGHRSDALCGARAGKTPTARVASRSRSGHGEIPAAPLFAGRAAPRLDGSTVRSC